MARREQQAFEDDEPGLDISSLIDVCFLLLIYFLVTTTIQPRESDLQMQLPASAPSESTPDIDPMFIRVDAAGAIYQGSGADAEKLDTDLDDHRLPKLLERLSVYVSTAGEGNEPLVQIWVDAEAQQQRVIDVLNALAAKEITKVTFTDLIDN